MKNTKHQLIPFSFYDLTGMERHLERMAERGWLLDKISALGWRYHRIEPKRLHFTVSYCHRASAYDPEPTEEVQTFHDFCAHPGWRLAAEFGSMQVFYNDQEDPTPHRHRPRPGAPDGGPGGPEELAGPVPPAAPGTLDGGLLVLQHGPCAH